MTTEPLLSGSAPARRGRPSGRERDAGGEARQQSKFVLGNSKKTRNYGRPAPEGDPGDLIFNYSESLILAQNERWQRGLGMQVERDPEGSNTGR